MKWITGLELVNYRAFKGAYPSIDIPAKNHLLIYGENGSGKSSIFNGVKDFFQSSSNAAKQFEINFFSQLADPNAVGHVQLEVSDINAQGQKQNPLNYRFAKPDTASTHRVPVIQLANKVKGFLDYKRMLQTHLINTPVGQNPNLFSLIIEDLLADHLINRSGGGVTTYPLMDEWIRIHDPIKTLDRRHNAHWSARDELPLFEAILRALLVQVFTEFRRFIQEYFDPKLEIGVSFSQLEFRDNPWGIRKELFLSIRYAGSEIPSYHTFLNEARLSAIALCTYLAALKTYPPAASDLKVLYLDDVFIGLDTNNRIPLLKILKREFIDHGFQIFISTYDRQWFETARYWFDTEKCLFKCLELFVNDDNNNLATPDVPIVVDPSKDYFEMAKSHFAANDYPACANYLRKACESEIRRVLPSNQLLRVDHNTDEVKKIEKLETLAQNFISFGQANSLNLTPFNHFNTYKKIILNPLSHDDLDAPHYRKELIDGIDLVSQLKKVKTKVIVKAKDSFTSPLKVGIRDQMTLAMHIYKIIVLEDLQIIQQDADPLKLSIIKCSVQEGGATREFTNLHLAFDQLWSERGYTAPTNYNTFYHETRVSSHRRLTALMQF